MPELLFELGCEELPASFVRRAYEQLEAEIVRRVGDAGLGIDASKSLGTPRRLIVHVDGLPNRQPDRQTVQRGPVIKAAFDDAGAPTQALLGFCRSQDVAPEDVRREGEHVWVDKVVAGRPTREILAEVLPESVRALSFEKAMRWGQSRMRFARPIRWLLAVFDGATVPFDIEGVASGSASRGHRFNNPEPFEALALSSLLTQLRLRDVEPDPAERERVIREGACAVTRDEPELPPSLVDENVFLTEWPTALEGTFREEYLELPEPVLVTAMAKHERFFPVRLSNGRLTNRFISIRNSGVDSVVREGNEWVLNARFNDAKFFFDEDKKATLEAFLERTGRMVFQEQLGTVRMRADRIATLAAHVAQQVGEGADVVEAARVAGRLAKADLASGLVSELPSLQGVVGGHYARREGLELAVCHGIAGHYELDSAHAGEAAGRIVARCVLVADQVDKLCGYLGVGLAPSGSSDPFGLRRAATLVIEASWTWPGAIGSLEPIFAAAFAEYRTQEVALDEAGARTALDELMSSRYAALLEGARHDVIEAALPSDVPGALLDPRAVRLRVACLEAARDDTAFVQAATRPLNIVAAARKKGIAIAERTWDELDAASLDSPSGGALSAAAKAIEPKIAKAASEEDAIALLAALDGLEAPIHEFFEATMVMAEETEIRDRRLSLLERVGRMLRVAGDFSKLVVEG